ncbi:DUF11 domain-containing protein [Streptomyces sp. CB03911]|uniref:DUF11 domain-containing protein n=1 Tax=Streptomyces sp. CB03911 TaxID=1804758 RepID=UPI000938FF27|nr:DUF11 domain-containing protein [Streptomyces sp. CB03911]OKI18569.1 hypothetical protein A6A07_38180 [Streptomyces sp. CB03911]
MHRTAKRLRSLAALMVVLLTLALAPAMAHAAGTRPFSLTITHVECVDDCDGVGLEGLFEGHADFFVKVFINGEEHRTPTWDDSGDIDPFWTVSAQLPADVQTVPVTIQVWDEDAAPGGDDLGDASEHDDNNNLDLLVSYVDGKWKDARATTEHDVSWPRSCSTGDGESGSENDGPRVKVCWEASSVSENGDADGDGLLDGWERNGYNDDDDDKVDVDLPKMGADPNHKDIFLEIDSQAGHVPTRATIQALKAAFAAAPITAGSKAGARPGGVNAPPNPDGRPGINLHVDTGGQYDRNGSEGRSPVSDCADGRDNDDQDGRADGLDGQCSGKEPLEGSYEDPRPNCADDQDNDNDGLKNAADPDCQAGDNLGGGQILSGSPDTCELGENFYASKRVNFDRSRRWIFRYAQSVAYSKVGEPEQGARCDEDADGVPKLGGMGEVGGNDFVVFSLAAGGLMHELGHNLNLQHGGVEGHPNCSPNFVSVMNYDHVRGIDRVGGGHILDYSPPRIAIDGATRGAAPLPDLVENRLTEPTVLDPSDNQNTFVYVNTLGWKTHGELNVSADWNADGSTDPGAPIPPVNINDSGTGGFPEDCKNDSTDETLHGADEWSAVSLPFRQFGEHADGPLNPEQDPLPTLAAQDALSAEINTTDIGVTVSDNPDPVAAGTDITYTAVVTNHGFSPSLATVLTDTLPAEAVFVTSDAGCRADGATVNCGVGHLLPGASRTVTITAHVPADLVHKAGGPVTLTNRAVADNLTGPDPVAANDTAVTGTTVVAVADLAVADFVAQTPPTQLVIGRTLDVTLHGTVANSGPSSPMDATLTTAAVPDPGATVTPASSTQSVPALAVGAARTADSTFKVGCDRPGSHTYRFTATVAPTRPGDTDPVEANNHRPVEFTLDCIVPVRIDVEPEGGLPTPVVVPRGITTVAVLTTAAGEYGLPLAFDAAAVQVPTVRFGPGRVVYAGPGGSTEPHPAGHLIDVVERTANPVEAVKDGDLDLVLHFDTEPSGVQVGDTEVCVKGSYTDRASAQTYRFFGCKAVRVLPF